MAVAENSTELSTQADESDRRRWGEFIIEGIIRLAGISSIVIIACRRDTP